MKTTTPLRRCCHCTRPFVPEPRVGDRQMTCGDEACQRARHSERCRAWHEQNREVTASHYQDVVVPFRQQQPDYQRRWRLGRKLREIRETMMPPGSVMLSSLRALLGRAEDLSKRAARNTQTGVLAGEMLSRARVALRGLVAAIEQLEANVSELQSLGL